MKNSELEMGSGFSWDKFFDEHYETLLAYAAKLCRQFNIDVSRAQDFVHELYLKLIELQLKGQAGEVRNPLAFCYTLLRNSMVDEQRKGKNVDYHLDDEERIVREETDDHRSENQILNSFVLEELKKVLTDEELIILNLYAQNLRNTEIAWMLGYNPSTMNVKIHRIKQKIRAFFEQDDQSVTEN